MEYGIYVYEIWTWDLELDLGNDILESMGDMSGHGVVDLATF
jgi:hypothetical protein